MDTIRTCHSCGKALPPSAPEGLCPECLAGVALGSEPAAVPGVKAKLADSKATLKIGPEAFARVKYFGDYELLEEIARGGMGVVWKARQTSLNRLVAVKMILAGKFAGPAEMQRFRREAEAAANLQHPNIVAIHEVGDHDGQQYYSMDFIAGRDLSAIVRANGPLPPAQAAEYLQTIAEAVHFAHQRGTLHRDLKPQNVLVDAAGVPRITDFGLAKFIERDDDLTQSGAVMGSPSYMPPEQAAGQLDRVGPASDVYSLGAILYELLTGRPPFQEDTVMATMRQSMESDPVALRKLNPAVPPDLENICLKCLEKNPLRRYPSAGALAGDLGRFRRKEPIQALPVSGFRKMESWLRRHPWMLVASGSLVVMVLTGTVYWLYERVQFLEYQLRPEGSPAAHFESVGLGSNFFHSLLAVYILDIIAIVTFVQVARGRKKWRQIMAFDLSGNLGANRPLSQSLRIAFGLFGIGGLGFAVVYCGALIRAGVWGNVVRLDVGEELCVWIFGYGCFIQNGILLWRVVRDYQNSVHGFSHHSLPAGHSDELRQAVFDGDFFGAFKMYRRMTPEVSLREARNFVAGLEAELRLNQPEEFAPPPAWWHLNWPALTVCLVIELLVIMSFWLWRPQGLTGSQLDVASGFALSVCFGGMPFLKLFFGLSPKRLCAICLCLLPVALAGLVSVGATLVISILFGPLIVAAGWPRKRRKQVLEKVPRAI